MDWLLSVIAVIRKVHTFNGLIRQTVHAKGACMQPSALLEK